MNNRLVKSFFIGAAIGGVIVVVVFFVTRNLLDMFMPLAALTPTITPVYTSTPTITPTRMVQPTATVKPTRTLRPTTSPPPPSTPRPTQPRPTPSPTPTPVFSFEYEGTRYEYPGLPVEPDTASGEDLKHNPVTVNVSAGTDGEHLIYSLEFVNDGDERMLPFVGTDGVVDNRRQAYDERCYGGFMFDVPPRAIKTVTCYTDMPQAAQATLYLKFPIEAQFVIVLENEQETLRPGIRH